MNKTSVEQRLMDQLRAQELAAHQRAEDLLKALFESTGLDTYIEEQIAKHERRHHE
jgi:hypothetical protein